jgi:ATP-dependent Clp protease ATP-binding subunit ClpC
MAYERISDDVRETLRVANQEAQRFNHESICCEHVLLALLKDVNVALLLKKFNVELYRIRRDLEQVMQADPEMNTIGKLPMASKVKRAIDYAMFEAEGLDHFYVGTEHLLLGLLRESENVAAEVLTNHGVVLEAMREEVRKALADARKASDGATASS